MFEDMAKTPAVWLSGSGDESMVVLSTRIRLARNVAGCRYPTNADSETRQRVVGYFDSVVSRDATLSQGQYYKASDIDDLDRDFLVERHLISPVFLNGDLSKAMLIGPEERISVMVNEEDHLRIQALASGLDVQKSYDLAMQ